MCITDELQNTSLSLGEIVLKQADQFFCNLKTVSNKSNICKYNVLAWEWIEVEIYVEWEYLLYFIKTHTAMQEK